MSDIQDTIICSKCKKTLHLPAGSGGRRVMCNTCRQKIYIPRDFTGKLKMPLAFAGSVLGFILGFLFIYKGTMDSYFISFLTVFGLSFVGFFLGIACSAFVERLMNGIENSKNP
ncbi:MAG: hypothetical protein PHO00_06400 [bacterium]|nr:hypothetical protein [bacterium]